MKKRSLRTVLAAALIVSCLSQSTSYGAWIENNSAWQYQEGEETVKGWGLIENEWYFFGPYGDMVTGWQKVADNGTFSILYPMVRKVRCLRGGNGLMDIAITLQK